MPNRTRARTLDRALYPLWAALCTLLSAHSFYRSMHQQTAGEWSAPLDDVFIHFDYARSAALGSPFHWVVGNGYSSGNTSLSYPFVLALGYALGFVGSSLMLWAATIAAASVFASLLLLRRWLQFCGAPRLASYALPPLLLAVGALSWSLWSGMEIAFFLAVWALAADRVLARVQLGSRAVPGWQLAATSILAVYTRPEAAVLVGCFALFLALQARGPHAPRGLRARAAVLARYAAPAVLAVLVQSAANRVLTGEASASGAVVKLAIYNPHWSRAAKWADYAFNARYALERNVTYHFADDAAYFFVLPLLALVPLCFARTRALALLLWGQIAAWTLLLGLNGQVRWQNERYTMPAVAWLLILVALGAGAALSAKPKLKPLAAWGLLAAMGTLAIAYAHPDAEHYPLKSAAYTAAICAAFALGVLYIRMLRAAALAIALLLFAQHQERKMRDQRWFFGRASRNVRDQQTTLGRYLRAMSDERDRLAREAPELPLSRTLQALPHAPETPRVLVGDAGAILYASDWRGLDIIGLGGYHQLPFARAGAEGLASVVELIERMPARERPTHMAIFPSWWGILPTWFGREVVQRFPAPGNVICGDYEHVLYTADWHLLGSGEAIQRLPAGTERVRDSIDFGDLVDERGHAYDWYPQAANGWTSQRILPITAGSREELWDGGRRIGAFHTLSFALRHLVAGRPLHLVLRVAPERTTKLRVRIGDATAAELSVARSTVWHEEDVVIPATLVSAEIRVFVENLGPEDFAVFHGYGVQ